MLASGQKTSTMYKKSGSSDMIASTKAESTTEL